MRGFIIRTAGHSRKMSRAPAREFPVRADTNSFTAADNASASAAGQKPGSRRNPFRSNSANMASIPFSLPVIVMIEKQLSVEAFIAEARHMDAFEWYPFPSEDADASNQ